MRFARLAAVAMSASVALSCSTAAGILSGAAPATDTRSNADRVLDAMAARASAGITSAPNLTFGPGSTPTLEPATPQPARLSTAAPPIVVPQTTAPQPQALTVVIVSSNYAQLTAFVTPGAICSGSAGSYLLSPSAQLAIHPASESAFANIAPAAGLAVVGWLIPFSAASYSNAVTCSFLGITRTANQVAVLPTFQPTPFVPTAGPLRTETFTGVVSKGGTAKDFTITLATRGTVKASLTWSGYPATALELYLNRGADTVAGADVLGQPLTLSFFAVTGGTYVLSVGAMSGTANFTLTATHP